MTTAERSAAPARSHAAAEVRLAITAALPLLRRAQALAGAMQLPDVRDSLWLAECRIEAAARALSDARVGPMR